MTARSNRRANAEPLMDLGGVTSTRRERAPHPPPRRRASHSLHQVGSPLAFRPVDIDAWLDDKRRRCESALPQRRGREGKSALVPRWSHKWRSIGGLDGQWWLSSQRSELVFLPDQSRFPVAPSAGFEPAHTAPEADALSPELRGPNRRQ